MTDRVARFKRQRAIEQSEREEADKTSKPRTSVTKKYAAPQRRLGDDGTRRRQLACAMSAYGHDFDVDLGRCTRCGMSVAALDD